MPILDISRYAKGCRKSAADFTLEVAETCSCSDVADAVCAYVASRTFVGCDGDRLVVTDDGPRRRYQWTFRVRVLAGGVRGVDARPRYSVTDYVEGPPVIVRAP